MNEDVVNHPNHYNQYNGFEVIDVCEQLRDPDGKGNYNRGNAFKYLARAGWKNPDKHVEDLEKAKFYIQREIDRIKSNDWMDRDPDHLGDDCPVCGIKLITMWQSMTDFICPNNHGWMDTLDDKKVWHSDDLVDSVSEAAKQINAELEVAKKTNAPRVAEVIG